jgi:hypothetical protein
MSLYPSNMKQENQEIVRLVVTSTILPLPQTLENFSHSKAYGSYGQFRYAQHTL